VGARFTAPIQTGPVAHPASCTTGTGSFPGVESGRGVTITPQTLLAPRYKNIVELYLDSPYGTSWPIKRVKPTYLHKCIHDCDQCSLTSGSCFTGTDSGSENTHTRLLKSRTKYRVLLIQYTYNVTIFYHRKLKNPVISFLIYATDKYILFLVVSSLKQITCVRGFIRIFEVYSRKIGL
jgi:hypothetical protein